MSTSSSGGATPAMLRTRSWMTWLGFTIVGFITIVLLLILWWMHKSTPKVPPDQRQPTCSPASDVRVNRCVLSEKPLIFTTEQLAYSEVLELCIVQPEGSSPYESKKVGPHTFEIRSTSGMVPIEYKLLKGVCPNKF